jgi:hypothetical protein
LDENRENFLIQSINEFIADLAEHGLESPAKTVRAEDAPLIEFKKPIHARDLRVVCIPASDRADESTAAMLTPNSRIGWLYGCAPTYSSLSWGCARPGFQARMRCCMHLGIGAVRAAPCSVFD